MIDAAERDAVQDQLCARIEELEHDKAALAEQLDGIESEAQRLRKDNHDLRREVAGWRGQ